MGRNQHATTETADTRRRASTTGARTRLSRAQRREQILESATRAVVRGGGVAATSLDDVAAESGVTRMILYRHFASRDELFHAAVERVAHRIHEAATGTTEQLDTTSVPGLVDLAARDPDGFRLLFWYAERDPILSGQVEEVRAAMAAALLPHIPHRTAEDPWRIWSARLATAVVVDAIMAWIELGQPDPDRAPERVLQALSGVYRAAEAD